MQLAVGLLVPGVINKHGEVMMPNGQYHHSDIVWILPQPGRSNVQRIEHCFADRCKNNNFWRLRQSGKDI